MKPHAPVNRIFVTADKVWDDEIVFDSGVKLYKDTTFEPEWNVHIHGYVATLPLEFRKDSMNNGMPCDVQPGDKVYFHYFTLKEDENMVEVDGVKYYAVEYNKIFAKVVNGELIPVHGYNLIDIVEDIIEHDGSIIIPDQLKKKKVDTYGRVALPSLTGLFLSPGDTVYFHSAYAFKNKIEDREYYVINTDDILAYKHN